jgi:tRNA-dihydrouridine synthase A
LRYAVAYQLKREFPDLEIIVNGGIKTDDEIALHLEHVDGVMLGREAYHNPYVMAGWDARFYGADAPVKSREQVLEAMIPYIRAQLDQYGPLGLRLNSITRHMLGLMAGLPGARAYRQLLSDSRRLAAGDPHLLLEAGSRLPKAA